MALDKQQIIALQQIKGCGVKTALGIAEHAKDREINNAETFLNLINECVKDKVISRFKEQEIDTVEQALYKASVIIQNSYNNGIGVITRYDSLFPESLKHVINREGKEDSPILLYYKGDVNVLSMPAIAIIGTREPTPEGVDAGQFYGKYYADKGYNIISGLAVGCDTTAHQGALKSSTGKTTAFLAHGLDSVYPKSNAKLAQEILDKGGLLLSEYPINTAINRYNLVARDRLQAGLAQATIVIQTGEKGGTMHAAHATLASNKPLYCVEFKSQDIMELEKVLGNTLLVKNGAKFLNSKNPLELIDAINNSQKKKSTEVKQGNLFKP